MVNAKDGFVFSVVAFASWAPRTIRPDVERIVASIAISQVILNVFLIFLPVWTLLF